MAPYALTISPPSRPQAPRYLYNDDKPFIQKQLNRCSNRYIMYPEFSIDGRLHYHGIIYLDTYSSWGYVKATITKNLGFSCIKPLKTFKDKLGWLLYCQKEERSTMPAPIMYHTFKKGRPRQKLPETQDRAQLTILDYM